MRHKHNVILSFLLLIIVTVTTNAQSDLRDSLLFENEVSYNLGYSNLLPKWMVTNSVSVITSNDIENSLSTNLGNKLHGKLPGLTVLQSNNEPGYDSPSLFSRGLGTYFGGGSDVLIIVDGFQSFYEQLIPEEIESITLLKDAAATTMYGMKGANGVLLITTKKGKEGPLKIDFSMQLGFSQPHRLPDFLNSYDHSRLYNEALFNDNSPLLYTENDLDAYRTGNDPFFHPDVNWHDQILRNSVPVSKVNLSFSGGQNRAKYFVLLNVINNSGLYKKTESMTDFSANSTFSRYNIRANVDLDITDRLFASAKLGFTVEDKSNPAGYSTSGIFSMMSATPPNSFPIYNPNGTYGGNSRYGNPWGSILEAGSYTWNQRTSQTSLLLRHDLDMITKGLDVSAAISFNNSFRGYSAKSRNFERFSISKDAEEEVVYTKFGEETSLQASEWEFKQWRNNTFQVFSNYKKAFYGNNIDASLGFDSDSYTQQGDQTDFRQLGFNGRVTYSHQKKYIGEMTFGYYGSNAFKKGKRWGLFPGISLGWILSNEGFLKDITWVDFLKIKSSYGISGVNLLGHQRFRYDQYYHYQGSYIYGSESIGGYADSHLANPDLTWEKKSEINIGLEAALFKNFNFNLDVFKQHRYDIMAEPLSEIPRYVGIIYPYWNIGEVDNVGFEAQIGYKNKLSKDFTLSTDLNLTYAKNEITNMPEIAQQDEYRLNTGKSINQPFVLEAIGFFENELDIQNSPVQTFGPVQPGDLKYKDQNNDGVIDTRDYYPIGYTNLPQLSMGLNVGLEFKNIYFDMFIQGVANRTVYLPSYYHAFENDGRVADIALGRWTVDNHETATYPRLSAINNNNNHGVGSSFWQRDGSFVKLRNVEFGYSIPISLIEKIGLSSAKIFVNGTNVFTLDHVDIADPEILSGYPAMKTFSIGVNVKL